MLDPSFLEGAIDYYVHAAPDASPRRADDIDCARGIKAAGLRAAVHRHHYGSTAERAALAARATDFEYYGALELNACVGGINPAAVDVALNAGAVLVSMPTNSAVNLQVPGSWAHGVERRLGLRLDHGSVAAVDEHGELLDATHTVIDLVADANATLGLGYMAFEECMAVATAAVSRGVDRIVLTNPTAITGMSVDEVLTLTALPGVYVEVVAFTLHPESTGGTANTDRLLAMAAGTLVQSAAPTDPQIPNRLADLIRRVGPSRCVLSSDGGHAGAVAPPEELLWACQTLAERNFSEAELRDLVGTVPARLLGR